MRMFRRLGIVRLVIILLIVGGLGVAYFLVITQFQQETNRRNENLY